MGVIDPEATAMGGAYKPRDLLRWSELNTFRIQKQIAQAHIDSIAESLWKGEDFKKGYTPEQLADYLDGIEKAVSAH